MYGCDCYAYGLLAAGHCDMVVEADLKPYDYMALVPIVKGAGGTFTDWKGEELRWQGSEDALASGDFRERCASRGTPERTPRPSPCSTRERRCPRRNPTGKDIREGCAGRAAF